MNLTEKIQKINKEYSIKEKEAIGKLNEEKEFLIAEATINEIKEQANRLPVGDLFRIFESVSEDVLFTAPGKSIINSFVSVVRGNQPLREQYFLIHNIAESKYSDSLNLLKESLELINIPSKLEFAEAKGRIAECVVRALDVINPLDAYKKISVDEKSHRLHEGIEFLATTERNVKTLAEYKNKVNEAVDFMKEYAIAKSVNEDKKSIFFSKKTECLEAIENAWKTADSSLRLTLTEIRDRLSKKEFSEVTADEDIKYINELKATLA